MTQTFVRISKNLIVLVNLKFLNGQNEKIKSKKLAGANVLRYLGMLLVPRSLVVAHRPAPILSSKK
jgi:hypothetical protein